jgi:hypothetical protein
MNRKIFILTLLGVFLVSATGLPLSLHICSMDGLSSASSCKMHNVVKEDHSCCNKEEESPVKLTVNHFDGCCQFKIIDRNLTDQFVTTTNDISLKSSVKVSLTGIIDTYSAPDFIDSFTYNSNSPPLTAGNHLYLNISVFLI